MDLLQEKVRIADQKAEEIKKLLEKFRKKLALANKKLRTYLRRAEENPKCRLEQEKDLFLLEKYIFFLEQDPFLLDKDLFLLEKYIMLLEKDLFLLQKDQHRNAYQKLLKENHDLEQQVEFLQQKLTLHVPGHSRSLSNTSSGSRHITSKDLPSDDHNIDFGYESIKSTASSSTPYSRVETIDWNQQRTDSSSDYEISVTKSSLDRNGPAHAPVDAGLVLKLLQKLKDTVKENERLNRMVEDVELSIKIQKVEMENENLNKYLGSLRKTVPEGDPVTTQKHLMDNFFPFYYICKIKQFLIFKIFGKS